MGRPPPKFPTLTAEEAAQRRARILETLAGAVAALRREGIPVPDSAMIGTAAFLATIRDTLGLEVALRFLGEVRQTLAKGPTEH